jgi:hypothetical protein
MSPYVLFFCQYWTCRNDAFHCLIKLFTFCICLCFCLQYLCRMTFVLQCLILCCFYFTSNLFNNSHRNLSSPPINSLSTHPIYSLCSTLLSYSVFITLIIFLYVWSNFICFIVIYWLDFAGFVIFYFIFGWLLSWLFTKWSSVYFVFRYSAVYNYLCLICRFIL